MSHAMHKRMLEQPETIVSNGVKGWYKGRFFRSAYEYFFLKRLDEEGVQYDDIVLEPYQIPYTFEGQSHVYVPDFLVISRSTVYEVKDSAMLSDARVKAKTAAALDFLREKQQIFQFVTEKELNIPRGQPMTELLSADHYVFLVPDSSKPIDLRFMFEKQIEFMNILRQERDHPDFPVDMTSKSGQRYVKDIAHDCMHELFEAIHLLSDAKKHRKTLVGNFNRDAFLEELADTLHFYVGLCALANVSADDLYRAYMKKGTVNISRVFNGY